MIKFPHENPGRVVDSYQLGRELGSGAFSRVVEGTHLKTGQKYAVKIVNKEETNAREMFSELTIMSLLDHTNVVCFKEIFDEEDGYYVVLELITGGELFDRIIELRRYTEKDAAHVMRQAFLGLKHMHDKNLVHRDIKPENLLLSSKESDATVKLADFGFSKAIKTDTDLFETLGTPPYMAPEIVVLRNEDEDYPGYGRPVDVWALGICLYILLSGIHPYQIEDEERMLDNIEDGLWPGWKGNNWNLISEEAKDLIKGMMNPDAKLRLNLSACLEHPWMLGHAPEQEIGGVQEAVKNYQAKKKLKSAIRGIMATNKLQLFLNAGKPGAPAAPASAPTLPTTAAPKPAPKPVAWSVLRVTVLGGRDLAVKDPNGKADPYVTMWCGPNKPFKSSIKYKTLNPVWEDNNSTDFSATSCSGKVLEIEVWDHDLIPPDEFMGRISLPVASFEVGTVYKQYYKLEKGAEKAKRCTVKGDLLVQIQKVPIQ